MPYLEFLRRAEPRPKIVFYSPVEAGPIAPEIMRQLQGVARYVLFTEYGRREIEAALQAVRRDDPAFEFPELEIIPHGVDRDRFFPIADEEGDSGKRPTSNAQRPTPKGEGEARGWLRGVF